MNSTFGMQKFVTGCNYWASHAGIDMWKKWDENVIRDDFAKLKSLHLELVRCFPLWPDFQPLVSLSSGQNNPCELRWKGEQEIPYDADGSQSGVDPEMLQRFRSLCDCAVENNIRLGVGLITGWMSGRLYLPPAFAHCNPLRDPQAIRWQLKFIRRFVSEFKDHPAIAFWETGNECNCLGKANRMEGALWTRAISDAIRAADPEHPVFSGMHSLYPNPVSSATNPEPWSIQDMAEDFDVLTTHPYPLFSPYCAVDRLGGFKSVMHASAESRFYADIAKRPCIAEELGTLAPTLGNETRAGKYLYNTLLNLWAHDCEGLLWWCAFDQLMFSQPPYQWCATERQLGLFRADGTPKPVAESMKRFYEMRNALPVKDLPSFKKDAVCILTGSQDTWMAAYGSWVLAKQAGLDIEFQFSDEPVRDAEAYLLPMLSGWRNSPRDRYFDLMHRVEAGATLYCSFEHGCISPFDEFFGVTAEYQEYSPGKCTTVINGNELEFNYESKLTVSAAGAEVLAVDEEDDPVFTRFRLGRGWVYFIIHSPERQIITRKRMADKSYFDIYKIWGRELLEKRLAVSGNPVVSSTVHVLSESEAVALLINNGEEETVVTPTIHPQWRAEKTSCSILPHDVCILRLKKS